MPTEHDNHRELLSFTRQHCYVTVDGTLRPASDVFITQGCTDEPASSPPCSVDSVIGPGNLCKMTGNEHGVDKNRWESTFEFEHCSMSYKYVRSDDTSQYYCERLESTGDWSTRRRPASRAESSNDGWWTCGWWSGYEWHDGACRDSTRYLGEECWDDSGECYNEGVAPYDGLRLACATDESAGVIGTPRCIPAAYMLDSHRNACECNWFDWNFLVACGADQCNGHACVASTGPNGWQCDYQTDNNW